MASFVQELSGSTGSAAGTTATASLPAGTTAGNTLLLIVGADSTVTTPTGFTLDQSQVQDCGHYLFRKTAVAGETSWTVTTGATATIGWYAAEISGMLATPVDVKALGAVNGTVRSTGTTTATTQAAELAIASWCELAQNNAPADWTGLTNGFTKRLADIKTNRPGTSIGMAVAAQTLTTSGTVESSAANADGSISTATSFVVTYKVSAGASSVSLAVSSGHVASVGEGVTVTATAGGGSGTKTYAWTSTGTGGTFTTPTAASTSWTPSAAGTATLTCTVTDTVSGTATATTTVVAVATGTAGTVTTTGTVTLLGGAATAQAALADTNPATGVDCAAGATVTSVLPAVYKPTVGGLPITLTGSISGGGATASFAVQLQENLSGTTWTNVGTAQTATLTATDSAVTVTIPQTALDAANAGSYGTAGKMRLVLTAAAA